MLLLYCASKHRLTQLTLAVPTGFDTRPTTSLRECLRESAVATCLVVGVLDGADADDYAWLPRRPGSAHVPLVIVVPEDTAILRAIAVAGATEIVLWRSLRRELPSAVDRAIESTLLGRIARAMEMGTEIPQPLRTALAAACRASRPVISVRQLASMAGTSIRWLQTLWRRVVRDDAYRLKDFVDWLLLLRVHHLVNVVSNTDELTTVVGRDKQTLERMSRRLVGVSLAEFRRMPAEAVVETFYSAALIPIASGTMVRELT